MPHVSVIIPTFNCARWLSLAVESVYAQTYRDFEILVVDDGSTDDTPEAIKPYLGRADFGYIRQPNGGASSARNTGANNATGQYVAFLDADDEFAPSALEMMVSEVERHNASWIITDVLKLIGKETQYFTSKVPDSNLFEGILRTDFVQWGYFYRREDLLEAGSFDEQMRAREDWDINIRMLERGKKFAYIPMSLYRYRWRENSTMTSVDRIPIFDQTLFLLRKHHKRLADAGDRRTASIYAKKLFRLSRSYLLTGHRLAKATACFTEGLRYDPTLLAVLFGRRVHRRVSNWKRAFFRRKGETSS